MPSVGILLHEMIKLMFHAKVVDPVFFRIGTSGGIGIEGGTVIISDEAVDGKLQPCLELVRVNLFFILTISITNNNYEFMIMIMITTYI